MKNFKLVLFSEKDKQELIKGCEYLDLTPDSCNIEICIGQDDGPSCSAIDICNVYDNSHCSVADQCDRDGDEGCSLSDICYTSDSPTVDCTWDTCVKDGYCGTSD